MPLTLQFSTNTTAFTELGVGEVFRVIDRVRRAIDAGERCGSVRDSGGVVIGNWTLTFAESLMRQQPAGQGLDRPAVE